MLSTNTQHWSLRWRSGIHVNAILGGGLFILSQPQGNSAPGLQVWVDLRAPARSKFNANVQTRSTIGCPNLNSSKHGTGPYHTAKASRKNTPFNLLRLLRSHKLQCFVFVLNKSLQFYFYKRRQSGIITHNFYWNLRLFFPQAHPPIFVELGATAGTMENGWV